MSDDGTTEFLECTARADKRFENEFEKCKFIGIETPQDAERFNKCVEKADKFRGDCYGCCYEDLINYRPENHKNK